ncbi:glycosylhydrolase-like jelly roll fold domain-containing protein [Mucilaginibacter humi]|uniref:glycosylhydrolase-like jelly roll fold domain-containing protein n=1 Tax=Mucilaginibacter humi TaxID=2732510 RepID=UPI003742912A
MVFAKDADLPIATAKNKNFTAPVTIATLIGPWNVSFDPKWGGPKNIVFDNLQDWTLRPENGIKYYSGLATYTKQFDMPSTKGKLFIYGPD